MQLLQLETHVRNLRFDHMKVAGRRTAFVDAPGIGLDEGIPVDRDTPQGVVCELRSKSKEYAKTARELGRRIAKPKTNRGGKKANEVTLALCKSYGLGVPWRTALIGYYTSKRLRLPTRSRIKTEIATARRYVARRTSPGLPRTS
jgi:hypothetical protein